MNGEPVHVELKDGMKILLRPAGLEDEARFAHIVENMSPEARYLRFFSGAKKIPETIIHMLADADGHRHIAWAAVDLDSPGEPFIAAAHAIRSRSETEAELALGMLDAYQGQGLSRMLIALIALSCREEGVISLEAETLAENRRANNLFRTLGGHVIRSSPPTTLWQFHVGELIATLRAMERPRGLRQIFRVVDSSTPS